MTAAAAASLGRRIDEALVVAPVGSRPRASPRAPRRPRAPPPPDEPSLAAGEAALALARRREGDLLLVLLSGGGSSLMAVPAEGLSLEDKSRTASLLMAAGAPIAELNLVRGALSRVKAGRPRPPRRRRRRHAGPLGPGDDGWHLVVSGPTLGVPPWPADARAILERYRLGPLVPQAVRAYLDTCRRGRRTRRPALERPPRRHQDGSRGGAGRGEPPRRRCARRPRAALGRGAGGRPPPRPRGGDRGQPGGSHAARPHLTLFGGETTVTVTGPGRGGRNRELALATAYAISGIPGATILWPGRTASTTNPTRPARSRTGRRSSAPRRPASTPQRAPRQRHGAVLRGARRRVRSGADGDERRRCRFRPCAGPGRRKCRRHKIPGGRGGSGCRAS